MCVFVLIPVFNRLSHTIKIVECLRKQTLANDIAITVINDGSTDGTADYLREQNDITVITGDGGLWWGGAIEAGLRKMLPKASDDDYVLLLNNDTWFATDYVECLVSASRRNANAAIGSAILEEDKDPPLVSIGARVNINRLAVWDIFSELDLEERRNPKEFYSVDALSGRGTLYPAGLFRRYGLMRPRLLPHYMADYELAMRFRRAGVKLVVSTRAAVYSPPVYGNDASGVSAWKRMFGRRSAHNIFQRTIFYCLVGSPLQRITAPLRIAYFDSCRAISSWRSGHRKEFTA
jgi:GT2 family glycosyltransferase